MRQVSRYTITVILEQEHFQSFPEHWQWNVQQTEIGWKTVPHDWPVNGKTAVSVVCPRMWNSEFTGLSRAQVTPTAVWWRWLTVCLDRYGGAMPCHSADRRASDFTINKRIIIAPMRQDDLGLGLLPVEPNPRGDRTPFIYLFIYLRTQHSTSNIKSKIQWKLLSSKANEGLWVTYTRPIDVYLHRPII